MLILSPTLIIIRRFRESAQALGKAHALALLGAATTAATEVCPASNISMPPRSARRPPRSTATRHTRTPTPSLIQLSSLTPAILLILPLCGLHRLRQLHPTLTYYFSIYLFVINAWTCALYWHDKSQARFEGSGHGRVSESSLHVCEVLGGWPAALLARRWLRHKTHKVAYRVVFWLVVLGHEVVWCWVVRCI